MFDPTLKPALVIAVPESRNDSKAGDRKEKARVTGIRPGNDAPRVPPKKTTIWGLSISGTLVVLILFPQT